MIINLKRMMIMQRQMGNLSGSMLFLKRGVDGWAKPVEKEAYLAHLKCDLSDMMKQCRVLAKELGLYVVELEVLGDDRYEEARQNFKDKGKLESWI